MTDQSVFTRSRSTSIFILVSIILTFGFITPGLTQDRSTPREPVKHRSLAQNTALSIDDIIKMVKAGFSDETIILQIRQKGQSFNLSVDQMIQLKSASVSERVIQVMIDPTKADVVTATPKTKVAPEQMSTRSSANEQQSSKPSVLRGITVQDLTPDARQRHAKGFWAVTVTSVEPSSHAVLAGIKPGDIIESLVIGGEPRPASTGTPIEFMQAMKRCVLSCLVEIRREGENSTGFMKVGEADAQFISIYGQSSKALLAYRDTHTQRLYKSRPQANTAIPDADMQPLEAEPWGVIVRTANGVKQRTAPVSIRYRPKNPGDPKPWAVVVGGEEDSPTAPNASNPDAGTNDHESQTGFAQSDGISPSESVPRSSALWGVKVKVVTLTPSEAALQFGLSPTANIRPMVVESLDGMARAAEGDLRSGDVIHSVYLAGAQPYTNQGESSSTPKSTNAFYRLAELCVPDCLVTVTHAHEQAHILLWVRSENDAIDNRLLGNNFQLNHRLNSTVAYVDARSKVSYEPARGGGVVFRDGDTGKILGAIVLNEETAVQVANEMRVQASPTSVSRDARRSLTTEQINTAISQGIASPGQSQGLLLIDAGNQFGQAMAVLNSSAGNSKPWDQAPSSGFQITIFTPKSWIAQQASDAAQQGRKFTTTDVTDDMLKPVMRVTALPSTPPPAGSGLNLGQDVSSVGSIKLADASRKLFVEPMNRRPFAYQNLSGLIAEFSLEDLARVKKDNPEFYVLVTGPRNSHDFKVKKKHFERLPL